MISVEKIAQPVLKKLANNKLMLTHINKYKGSYITGIAIASIVSKDVLGMYYYVNQSLNNKKIPEEKRKFVAALDLTNGVLMVSFQIFAALALKKIQQKVFNKTFKKLLTKNSVENLTDKISKNSKKLLDSKDIEVIKMNVEQAHKEIKSGLFEGFEFLTSLIVSSIIIKRVIVPFISTPLADWAKRKFFDKNDSKVNEKDCYQSSISLKK